MNIGAMDKLCIFEKFTQKKNEWGHVTQEWAEFTRLYGNFQPLSSKEMISAQATQAESIARLITHFVDDIDSSMRVNIYGLAAAVQTFQIDGEPIPDNRSNRQHLTFNLRKI